MTDQTIVVRYIPYQLCPKCMGHGRIKAGSLDTSTSRTATLIVCDVCHGAKIIPMYEIKPPEESSFVDPNLPYE